mmetsp:Transcript_43673/g.105341  ORF Transcript_43673/g.105341 Transcript_43673/m.105341 type:complete len:591 (+) Transcript_43673:51-1823(+)
MMDDTEMPERPPTYDSMFINSIDTLQGRQIDQKMNRYPEWNVKPPLFTPFRPKRQRFWQEPVDDDAMYYEEPALLKGMIRKGIPPPLRCAVWMSNVVQSCNPHESLKYAHEYRTLAKVRALDGAYDSLYNNSLKKEDVKPMFFGNTIIEESVAGYKGSEALWRCLFGLHSVLGVVDYAPIVPALTKVLLSHMGESYAFCSIREMAHHSTWYWATSKSEHAAYKQAFLDILAKLHPSTSKTISEHGISDDYANAIFADFFQTILPEEGVLRIMDIYTLEGMKVLFRVGVAFAVLFHRQWKEGACYKSDDCWKTLVDFGKKVNIGTLITKAYGVHGKGVRKRFRFPRRPILQRIIKLEEDRYWRENENGVVEAPSVNPLGLVVPPNDEKHAQPELSQSSAVRCRLAEWLPLALRYTKLDLIFSTNHHGRTLENFYRESKRAKHTIMLIEPLDAPNTIIGCYASQTWHPSSRVYGDGGCFMFRIATDESKSAENSKCWKWQYPESKSFDDDDASVNSKTAILEQYQVGTREYFSMGGNAKGGAGLRLNEDLTRGESNKAAGFENEPLPGEEMFEVGLVEVYQLVREMDGLPIH